MTNRVLNNIRMPMVMKNDRLALQAAIFTCIDIDLQRPRIVRIANTSHVGTLDISEALLGEARANPGIEVLEASRDLVFNKEGNLF